MKFALGCLDNNLKVENEVELCWILFISYMYAEMKQSQCGMIVIYKKMVVKKHSIFGCH